MMAAVATNRKNTNLQAVEKRKRRSSDKPVSSCNNDSSTISRHSAARKVSIGREYHTRCRGSLRFKLLVRASVSKRKPKPRDCCGNNEEINREASNLFGRSKAALRFDRDDCKILVEKDSSTWGVRNCYNNLKASLLRSIEEPFIPLKEEELAEVKTAFSGRNRMKLLVSHRNSNIDICGETLQCLMPTRWLNDELVSGSCYNYQAVRRWTTKRKLGYDLIDCDIIFVPIHGCLHWTLAVINKRECKFQYLDSLTGVNPTVLNDLAKYLVDEVKDKSGQNIDVSSWDIEYVKDLPRQQNGYDCGMFMLKYIDFYSRGLRLQFSQKDMPYFRLRTAKEILRLRAQ
ncbi:PREDICTED: putative ubiquitin-like-specific protease 1B isoform X2 [Camelina sativa]|uniref:Ubiquitin-like-specific protease 1B isoform X2 n=1 Tax=Camelina sativa TaxID=90675 RepID=A0ABM0UJG3_CAMSA|nr:PREDICTED: putative ubiquitin-like-specific protease 1B isoform X2 [Camelina sativa]